MLQNVIAECLGIFITVFFIDRRIKQREEKRWLPAKNFLYSKLFTLANDFLVNFIPAKYWKIEPVVYYFGECEVMAGIEINNELLPEMVVNNFGLAEIVSETGVTETEKLKALRNEIKDVLSNSIELIEPELLSKLFDLESALVFLLKPDETSKDSTNTGITIDLLLKPIASVSLIRLWLLSKANRKISIDKFYEEEAQTLKDVKKEKNDLLLKAKQKNKK